MKFSITAILSLLTSCILPGSANTFRALPAPISQNMLFRIDENTCDEAQRITLKQSFADATRIANAALDTCAEANLSGHMMRIPGSDKCIDFNDFLAFDYFGSLAHMYKATQAEIGRIMYGASVIYQDQGQEPTTYQRIITVTCAADEDPKLCGDYGAAAVTGYNDRMTYYPLFFNDMQPFADRLQVLEDDAEGTMRLNVSNLISQGSITLHELLHICPFDTSSGRCPGLACEDWGVYGQDLSRSYAKAHEHVRSGRIAHHNDNYVFYALSKFMHKHFGVRPFYFQDNATNVEFLKIMETYNQGTWSYKSTLGQTTVIEQRVRKQALHDEL